MNLRQLEQFVAVAETASFSRGAERAHSSQPALSTALSKLEAELGVRLLNRRKKEVSLTAEGRRLLASAKSILAECDEVRASFRKMADAAKMRVGVCETLNLKRLAPLLERYRRSQPQVRLQVIEGSTRALAEALLAGDLEAAFLVTAGNEALAPGLDAVALRTEAYRLVVPDDHRFAEAGSIPVAALHEIPFIARTHCEYRHFLATLLTEKQIRPTVTYRTVQDERALELIRAGLGVGIFPESLVPPGMVAIRFDDDGLERRIHLARKGGRADQAISRFADFMRQALLF